MSVEGSVLPDVRRQDQQVLCRMAEQALETALDRDRVVVKRHSLGAPSERGTWVRLSVCTAASAARRGGLESTVAFPELAPSAPEVDATVTEWTVAHADLSWVNLTAPECWILDWEDAGLAPRGWDAATLWAASLAVPSLAGQVQQTFAADLDSRTGMVCQLYRVAELLQAGPGYVGDLFAPAQAAREWLIRALAHRSEMP